LNFASFGQYCEEALGMAERTVAQRVALERALQRHPALRRALQEKRITYEKARLIARHATKEDAPSWISAGARMTCVALHQALQDNHEAQMCARDEFEIWMPASVADLLKGTFRALRATAKRWMALKECVVALAEHFNATYQHLLDRAKTLARRVRARGKHFCQVPGCSRPAMHAHHIIPRSQGGTDDEWNLVGLCIAHHLHGIHGGRIRVTGRAPDQLVWEFGLRRSYAETAVA
jgi:hypothetical protein